MSGSDRALKEYFYRRRNAPGGLRQAIYDLNDVKKVHLEKFLDAEIAEGRPAGTTLSRDGDDRRPGAAQVVEGGTERARDHPVRTAPTTRSAWSHDRTA